MESPSSSTTWSEAFILSEDSGLLLTNSSISSGSISAENRNKNRAMSDDSHYEEKSLSQDETDEPYEVMCGENFDTMKKGYQWLDITKVASTLEPPYEFQDRPAESFLEWFSNKLSNEIILTALYELKKSVKKTLPLNLISCHFWNSEPLSFSPYHLKSLNSKNSLGSSRLSSSHNSLSIPAAHQVDDSTFISQAVSHDTLSINQISDLYNVPFDSDIYAVPIDVVKSPLKPKRNTQRRKRRKNTCSDYRDFHARQRYSTQKSSMQSKREHYSCCQSKRHSVAGTSALVDCEPIHMTLDEVRQYLQTLYSSSSESPDYKDKLPIPKLPPIFTNNKYRSTNNVLETSYCAIDSNPNVRLRKNTFLLNIKNKRSRGSYTLESKDIVKSDVKSDKRKKAGSKLLSLKQTLCSLFKFGKNITHNIKKDDYPSNGKKVYSSQNSLLHDGHSNIISRALPPLPLKEETTMEEEHVQDFASSIQRVKDCGWYWGPLSSEAAEKILSNEPDGSFIVRDSSDDHYIFSLTFKLNDCVRHVRIEHDQGNFSFGSRTKFKSQTIVEFIENAVEHSRSGRYLFFLHRRPVIGPVRVQLLHPVSRFKQIQSLQHICRFAIHKVVRRDLIPELPLPRRIIDYLNTPNYYSEHLFDLMESNAERPETTNEPSEPRGFQPVTLLANASANDYMMLNNSNSSRPNLRES